MTPEEQLELDLQVERDVRAAKQAKAAKQAEAAAASQQTARSEAMGGPMVIPEEQSQLDFRTIRDARIKYEQEQAVRPGFLTPLPAPLSQADLEVERSRVSAPGGEAEAPYLEAREATSIPFLRPTRIEEVQRGPGTERIIREPDQGKMRVVRGVPYANFGEVEEVEAPGSVRAPTAREELVESFARQPVLTRDAARALAAGEDPAGVNKRVGQLEGAVVESPLQALLAIPASATALAVEAYRRLPIQGTEPVMMTPRGLLKEGIEAGASAVRRAGQSPLLEKYLGTVGGEFAKGLTSGIAEAAEGVVPPDIEGKVYRGAVGAAKAATGVLERVAGVTPGTSPVAQELTTLGTPRAVIPAPASVEDKPISQRIREREFVSDVIQADPASAATFQREFGAAAEPAMLGTGFLLEMRLPFTPLGYLGKAASLTGATGAATKAATSALTKRAVANAETRLAGELFTRFTGGQKTIPPGLRLDDVEQAVVGRAPRGSVDAAFRTKVRQSVVQGRADLARVAPRTDLVRVAPSYAVPKNLADGATKAANAEVASLRSKARTNFGRGLTRAEETAARDVAVQRFAQTEARKLDELGQFQVLLDGLDTPRAWDTEFFRAARAVTSPEQAMKRAAVVAAEQEVARQGMNALRAFRKEVEAGTKAGKSLDEILEESGNRNLAGTSGEEIAKKVLEEAYGGERAAVLFPKVLTRLQNEAQDALQASGQVVRPTPDQLARLTEPYLRGLLRPDNARKMHEALEADRTVARLATSPNFAANATKIILEEGVRKTTSKQALEAFQRQYPGLKQPVLAALSRGQGALKGMGTLEEAKFFENGAEDLFRLADSVPTRAAGTAPSVAEGAERVAAAARNAQAKTRFPLVAEAKLLAGERLAAPVRAFLTTRYALPVNWDLVGTVTPSGYLRPDDITALIDNLGGFGPSRMDVARKGNMVEDILLSSAKGVKGAAKDVAMGRPLAYATADAIEEGYRTNVFVKALKEGKTPEAAMTLARRSQLDYGAADSGVIQALSPYWAGLVNSSAFGSEFIDQFARNPQAYNTYLRALREQQRAVDSDGEQGDLPLTRFYAPIPDDATQDAFGRPLEVLGPNAPGLEPINLTLGLAKTVASGEEFYGVIQDEGLIDAVLGGSVDAMDELAGKATTLAEGLGGAQEPTTPAIKARTKGGTAPTIDQTYMAIFALARAYDPDRSNGLQASAIRILEPDLATPPKNLAARSTKGSKAWAVRPPNVPGAFIIREELPIEGTDQKQEVFFLMKPSKAGRQRLKAIQGAPFGEFVSGPVRALGTYEEEGLGEALLWLIGAETVEEPTRKAVEQTRVAP